VTARVALPSAGRLREGSVALLEHAGYDIAGFRGTGARAEVGGVEFIEMRPRDAAAWLAAGRVDAAFISTDVVLEDDLGHLPALQLGFARADLVVASRDDDGRAEVADLASATVATHLPQATDRWLRGQGVDATVVAMGGALEGVCAAGLADAIVDLRATGTSLAQNRLRVLAEIAHCEALFVHQRSGAPADLVLRLQSALAGRRRRYVMLHLPPHLLDDLSGIFTGLASPTVLPLAGRGDLVAVHLVVEADAFWDRLTDLRQLGATGIVALPPDAVVT
jgi:ATP phosphoribosyltransferase